MKKLLKVKFVDPWTVHDVHWLAKKNRKVKVCGYCSLNSTWTVAADSQTHAKKKNKTQTSNVNAQSKPTLSVSKANESHQKGKTILLETSQRPIN